MNIAFGTVVYKESFQYYREFTDSINGQDFNDFDVVLLNDNLNAEELTKVANCLQKNKLVWYEKANSNNTPSELRVQLIKNAKINNYDLLILGDFDDTFSKNRVSRIVSEYDQSFSFYYNDIYFLGKEGKLFNSLPQYTNDIFDIIEHNYLGLSNTALNLNRIGLDLIDGLNNGQTSVFDWYMYSILLKEGHTGKKVDDCKTHYRIHMGNIAGESQSTSAGILKEIDIKISHYSQLKGVDIQFSELLEYYKDLKLKAEDGKVDLLEHISNENDYWWGRLNSNKLRLERKEHED